MWKAFLLMSVFVAVAMAAPVDKEKEKEKQDVLLQEILDIVMPNRDMESKEEIKKGDDSDDDDPQPPEEIVTPNEGKYEGDLILTPDQKDVFENENNPASRGGGDSDGDDPQPPEEIVTPTEGKYEGDLILTPEQKDAFENENNPARRGGGISSAVRKWPSNRVPYVLDGSLSTRARAAIAEAMADWQRYTCTRFTPRRNEKDYIIIFRGKGCYSYVGRIGGQQRLSIGKGCESKGTVIHELAHAQGIIHEQSRPDRDNYVYIVWANIKSNARSNFKKHPSASQDGPYDFDSVMHYGDKYFTSNGRRTIVARDPSKQNRIGSRRGFSKLDVRHANRYLRCGQRPAPPTRPRDTWAYRICYYVKIRGYCSYGPYKAKCMKTCS